MSLQSPNKVVDKSVGVGGGFASPPATAENILRMNVKDHLDTLCVKVSAIHQLVDNLSHNIFGDSTPNVVSDVGAPFAIPDKLAFLENFLSEIELRLERIKNRI